jgi:hypothetical protein
VYITILDEMENVAAKNFWHTLLQSPSPGGKKNERATLRCFDAVSFGRRTSELSM